MMMVITKATFCIFLVLITIVSSEDSEDAEIDFLSQLLDPESRLLDDNTVRLTLLYRIWYLIELLQGH